MASMTAMNQMVVRSRLLDFESDRRRDRHPSGRGNYTSLLSTYALVNWRGQ
jgi:hypothetical protein